MPRDEQWVNSAKWGAIGVNSAKFGNEAHFVSFAAIIASRSGRGLEFAYLKHCDCHY